MKKSILDESLSAIASWLNDQGYMELLLEECGCDCGDPEELEDHGCSAGLAECELVALRMHIGRIFTAYNTTERHNAELMAYIGRIGSCPPLNIQSHYAVIAQSLALLSREGKTLAATGALRSLDALKAEHSRQRKQIADADQALYRIAQGFDDASDFSNGKVALGWARGIALAALEKKP